MLRIQAHFPNFCVARLNLPPSPNSIRVNIFCKVDGVFFCNSENLNYLGRSSIFTGACTGLSDIMNPPMEFLPFIHGALSCAAHR